MMPAAIGSQVGGSIIRPAAFCGNVALKPSQGGINRGERQATSMSTHGVHAGCIEDVWITSIEIVKRCGGDRGYAGICGPDSPPEAVRPMRLMVLETEGWAELDNASKSAFGTLLERLQGAGITLLRRTDNPLIDALERSIADARTVAPAITAWENRWAIRNLLDTNADGVSERAKASHARAAQMTHHDYQMLLLRRAQAQAAHAAAGPLADAAITLSCPGPATPWSGDKPGQPLAPRPTGDAVFNTGSSMLFAPCVTMPLMSVGGLPVGAQVVGRPAQDARMVAHARWLIDNVEPVIG
jgi:Asp-tRNA(Asn)/Glu-tRNA(Gln) amidotransferase A subunit family amidase